MVLELEPWLDASREEWRVIDVEDWAEIRRLHRAEGLSIKEIVCFNALLAPARSLLSIAVRILRSAPRKRERNWRLCSRFLRLCRCALSADACWAT